MIQLKLGFQDPTPSQIREYLAGANRALAAMLNPGGVSLDPTLGHIKVDSVVVNSYVVTASCTTTGLSVGIGFGFSLCVTTRFVATVGNELTVDLLANSYTEQQTTRTIEKQRINLAAALLEARVMRACMRQIYGLRVE